MDRDIREDPRKSSSHSARFYGRPVASLSESSRINAKSGPDINNNREFRDSYLSDMDETAGCG